jgi:23S rRNA (guanosine2251-2'-O)-methyltransferase
MKGRKFVNEGRQRGASPTSLYGIHAIEAWLRVSPQRLQRIWIRARAQGKLLALADAARAARVPVEQVGDEQLNLLAGTTRHQGVVAAARDFEYTPVEDLVEGRPRLVVVLDQIQDPRNLGAILRTAAAVAAGGVVLPKDGAVGVTPAVEVAAAGAAASLKLARVTNLVRTVKFLQEQGYWAVALDPGGAVDIFSLDTGASIALVLGGETGIRPLLLRSCDLIASIPMPGAIESLNVSVAAALALYEIYRRGRVDSRRLP